MTVSRLGSKGKRWAAGRVSVISEPLYRRPSFPPPLFSGARHSAADVRRRRNLPFSLVFHSLCGGPSFRRRR